MTNCFLIADESAKQAVLFDAPDHTTAPLLEEASKRGWEVIGLWLTHGHFDHFADHQVVRQRFPKARILLHELEESKTQNPDMQTRLFGLPLIIPPLKPDAYVKAGDLLKIGSLEARVIHTPGHSPGHVVYYFEKQKTLVGGDMIIGGSIGRTDLPDSDFRDMVASLGEIMALPDDTRLLGGHGSDSTLGREREHNAYLQEMLLEGK